MKKFSKKTKKNLKHYVYVYSDPDSGQPFYIGKGVGDRVFSHLKDNKESEKVTYLKMLKENGKEPIIDILIHGVDDETAKKVEAAAIDLIGIENLTNKQRGYESSSYGKVNYKTLESKYSTEELKIDDIKESTILIRINKSYRHGMPENELYDVTRALWKINSKIARENKIKYAFAVYEGIVLEVYEISCWLPAYSTFRFNYKEWHESEKRSKRFEFVGRVADEKIRELYINKSVANLLPKGNRNSIKYINVK